MATATAIKVSAIQTPSPANTLLVQRQMKESVEVAQRLRGDPNDSYVRVGELVNTGLVQLIGGVVQLPNTPSSAGAPTITVADSIIGAGTSGTPLQLDGDAATPGNSMLYGTNGSGTKGWYAQAGGGGSLTVTDGTNTVASVTHIALTGAVVGGTSPNATVSISGGGGGGGNVTPDTHPASPTAWDDEFESGSSIDLTKWTLMGAAGGAFDVGQGCLLLAAAAAAGQISAVQATPTAPYTFVAKFAGSDNQAQGIVLYNSGNNAQITVLAISGTSGQNTIVQNNSFSSGSNPPFSSNQYVSSDYLTFGVQSQFRYYKIENDGTNIKVSLSATGTIGSFLLVSTQTIASWIAAVTHIGFTTWGGAPTSILSVDWFRRTA